MDKLLVKIKCRKCEKDFNATRWNIKKADVNDESLKDDGISVVYFVCPFCGEIHFVQIDNRETKYILAEMRMILVKKDKKKQDRYNELSKQLIEERNRLVKLYDGSLLVEIKGRTEKERFNFYSLDNGENNE